MGALQDRVKASLNDLDSEEQAENARHSATMARIASQRAALESTLPLLSDRLEGAVEALQKLGFLRTL